MQNLGRTGPGNSPVRVPEGTIRPLDTVFYLHTSAMAAAEPPVVLPTLDRLGVASVPADVDAQKVASLWFDSLSKYLEAGDIDGVLSLFSPDAWFRDMLALTWAFRTFHGTAKIRKFLEDKLAASKLTAFKLTDVKFENPYPDLAWILGQFTFETATGVASGVFRLVPTADGQWTGFTLYTNLEELKGFPEKVGPLRNHLPNHGKWLAQREREKEFVDADPKVLIVGGGQSGLDVAARLKFLDIPALVVEKNERIGDQWRNRYQALCLHDPVCECTSHRRNGFTSSTISRVRPPSVPSVSTHEHELPPPPR